MKVVVLHPPTEREVVLTCPCCRAANTVYVPIAQKAKGIKKCWRCRAELAYNEEE